MNRYTDNIDIPRMVELFHNGDLDYDRRMVDRLGIITCKTILKCDECPFNIDEERLFDGCLVSCSETEEYIVKKILTPNCPEIMI